MSKIREYIEQAESVVEDIPEIQKPFPVNASNPKEAKGSLTNGTPSKEPEQFLISLLNIQPFWQLFEHLADRHYQGKNISPKIIKFKKDHPCFFFTCVNFDILLRAFILSGLVAAAFRALYKILL